ncbi:MAG: hypothetical protein BWY89_01352 [Bacteroidetes bacterium ADurb.BinA012]|nr:MAG: hypothetical protein BWY89_01352 [Bacteroidetes bacterium ADurb.BinA012]
MQVGMDHHAAVQRESLEPYPVSREVAEYMVINILLVYSHIKQVTNRAHGVTGIVPVLKIARISDNTDIYRSDEFTVIELTAFHSVHQEVNQF